MSDEPEYFICLQCETPTYEFEMHNGKLSQAVCATCHVYVTEEWRSVLPAMAEDEDIMLEESHSERRPESRLSCQVPLAAELDGLVVHLPPTQA